MATFRNPIGPLADPWIVLDGGRYFLTGTSGDTLTVSSAVSLADLATTRPTVVWRDDEYSRSAMMWAPELHRFDDRWFVYYTASDPEDHLRHRMHVLHGPHPDGPFSYAGQLRTDRRDDRYAIDGSPVRLADGRMYFAWAGHPDHVLYLSRMSSPWELSGDRVHLRASGFGCSDIREGPVFLRRDGRVFLVYSACDTGTPDYRLGLLVADEAAELTAPGVWRQHPEPVLLRNDAAGVFGPGHNGFFRSPDGTEDWIVYHAKDTAEFTYEGRTARAQRFRWTAEGLPDFGVPLGLDTDVALPAGDPGPTG